MEISNNNYACYHWMEIRYNMMGQKGPEYVLINSRNIILWVSLQHDGTKRAIVCMTNVLE